MISSYGTVLFQKTIDVLVSQRVTDKQPFIESILQSPTVDEYILKIYERSNSLVDQVQGEKLFLLALLLTSKHYPESAEKATEYLNQIAKYTRILSNYDDYQLYNEVFFELVTKANPNDTEITKHQLTLATLSTKTQQYCGDAVKLAYVEYPQTRESVHALAMAIENLDLNPEGGLESELKAIMQHLTNPEELLADVNKFLHSETQVDVALELIHNLLEKVDAETKVAIFKKVTPELPYKFSSCSPRTLMYIAKILNLMPIPEEYNELDKFNIAVQLSFAAPNLSGAITSFDDPLVPMLIEFTQKRKDAPTFEIVVKSLAPYGVIIYAVNFGIFASYPDEVKNALKEPKFIIEAIHYLLKNNAVTDDTIQIVAEAYINALKSDILNDEEQLKKCVEILPQLNQFHAILLKLFLENCAYINNAIVVRKFCEFLIKSELAASEQFPLETIGTLARYLIIDEEDTQTTATVSKFLGILANMESIPCPTTANNIATYYCSEGDRMAQYQAYLLKQAIAFPNTGYEALAAGTPKLTDKNTTILTKNIENSYANQRLYSQYFISLSRNNVTQALEQFKVAVNDVVPALIQFTKPPPPKEFYDAAFFTILWLVQNVVKEEKDIKLLFAITRIAIPGPAMTDQCADSVIKTLKALITLNKGSIPDNVVKKILDSSFPEFIPIMFAAIGKERIDDAIITIIQHAMTKPFGYNYSEQLQAILNAGKKAKVLERFFQRFARLADRNDCIKLLELMAEVAKVARHLSIPYTSTKNDHEWIEIIIPYSIHVDEKIRGYALTILKNVYEVGCSVETSGLAHSEITTIVHTLWSEIVKRLDRDCILRVFKFCAKNLDKSEAASIFAAAVIDHRPDCIDEKDFDALFLLEANTFMFNNIFESLKKYSEDNKRRVVAKMFAIGYRPMTLSVFRAMIKEPDFVKAIFIEITAQQNHDKFLEIVEAFYETSEFDPVIFLIVLSFYSVQKQTRRKVKGLQSLMSSVLSQQIIKSTIINPQNLAIEDDLHLALKDIAFKTYNLSVDQLKAIAENAEAYVKSGEDMTSMTFGTLFAILAAQFAVLKTNQDLCLTFYKLFIMSIENATTHTAGFILAAFNQVTQEDIIEQISHEYKQSIIVHAAAALAETALSEKHIDDNLSLMCCVFSKFDEKAEVAEKVYVALDAASNKIAHRKDMMEALLTICHLQKVKFTEKGIARPAAILLRCFSERKDIAEIAYNILKEITEKETVEEVIFGTCENIERLPNVANNCVLSCTVPMITERTIEILHALAKFQTRIYSKAAGFYENLYPIAFKVIEEGDAELVDKATCLLKSFEK
ncbi:hypothetical protein TVAG_098000 [Trichomonas vaginalis G3]|uniref:Uncharacterized protein n=1 Tax=Trichomonas vaginalis (strain ATCC PRA-98 / G3) TaxID=412133 RepID=A2E2D0_TRIV3|nr:hypothetical protein TVAGG3_0964410 [Trichomonas vaginalis G3]EAY13230.1 hypothetical protein TVAG_098000 [Trichomonas vaginalis G3]KAI5488138.1 hypothetical protein TVAGG3_0964410 [Trichomonas vaginalis G3]|eukprot:XP_001325453.1 hypothetical protein [Trichomonas vaginalis G3]